MIVYLYPSRLRNTILCTCMYLHSARTSIVQFHGQNVSPGTIMALDYCVARIFSMEEHKHKRFKSLPRSLRTTYNFRNDLKIHLNVCQVCCSWKDRFDSGVV